MGASAWFYVRLGFFKAYLFTHDLEGLPGSDLTLLADCHTDLRQEIGRTQLAIPLPA